eukprot:GEMP01066745.1.p1 GENE.GEMP01066745.1~~GEMP01066745.1.p1  ORF type:complete len:284 (+),score=53.06 GEMP01066745.1:193-1044(+)
MQFTPQQLTGGPRYGSRCRIGNWNEDTEMSDIAMKDYLKKKESGGLLVNAKLRRMEEALEPSILTTKTDDRVRFGNRLMLVNHESEGFLSANLYDVVVKTDHAYAVTTSPCANPCIRNVFRLVRADANDGLGDSDVLHYGQQFRIQLDRAPEDLYLHSEPVSVLSASKFSRHQEVLAYAKPNGNTLWQILFPDTRDRFDTDREPVSIDGPVVFRHVQTGSFLSSGKIPYSHIFGVENEVHCHVYYSTNKTHNLAGEKKGVITGDYCLRRHGIQNMWSVFLGNQ